MLLLSARASREIVKAIEASAESNAKSMDANTEALKRIEGKIDGIMEALKRLEDKTDGQTEDLEHTEDLVSMQGKGGHDGDA